MTNHTSMNQQELLTDLLTQEKDLVKDYASGITESSCTNLRELLMSNLAECSAAQTSDVRHQTGSGIRRSDGSQQDAAAQTADRLLISLCIHR